MSYITTEKAAHILLAPSKIFASSNSRLAKTAAVIAALVFLPFTLLGKLLLRYSKQEPILPIRNIISVPEALPNGNPENDLKVVVGQQNSAPPQRPPRPQSMPPLRPLRPQSWPLPAKALEKLTQAEFMLLDKLDYFPQDQRLSHHTMLQDLYTAMKGLDNSLWNLKKPISDLWALRPKFAEAGIHPFAYFIMAKKMNVQYFGENRNVFCICHNQRQEALLEAAKEGIEAKWDTFHEYLSEFCEVFGKDKEEILKLIPGKEKKAKQWLPLLQYLFDLKNH